MKKAHIKLRTLIIAIVLLASLFAFFMMMYSFAAYSDVSRSKKVISTSETQVFFSAKYLELYPCDEVNNPTGVSTTAVATNDNIVTSINNFVLGNPLSRNDADITYRLEITIPTVGEVTYLNTDYNVQVNNIDSYSFNAHGEAKAGNAWPVYTLRGGRNNSDTISIKVPVNTELSIKAIPINNTAGATLNNMLYGVLKKVNVESGGGQTDSWDGELVIDDNKTVSDYAGLTYQISGTGTGTVTVSWDSTKAEIDRDPVELYKTVIDMNNVEQRQSIASQPAPVAGRTGWKYITVTIDEDCLETYQIRFYRASAFDEAEAWTSYFECSYAAG